MKILLIGGGNMGFAMLNGLSKHDVTVVDHNAANSKKLREHFPAVRVVKSAQKLDGETVILAIKPQSFRQLEPLRGEAGAVVSVMAGVLIAELKGIVKARHYVRFMPNICAHEGASATIITGDEAFKKEALDLARGFGSGLWVKTEKDLDAYSALAGCTPAWLALVAEALSDGSVACGVKRADSYELIAELFEGTAKLLRHNHPAILKDLVSSPAGTTIKGLQKLEAAGVRNAFYQALAAAFTKPV